jgi:hypothetical protein
MSRSWTAKVTFFSSQSFARSACGALASYRRVSHPARANTSAQLRPIVPVPITVAILGLGIEFLFTSTVITGDGFYHSA